jgi:ribosomal protection tetracycline resistance protein
LLRRTLNLGIVAHVDAGKTTLTERLLYAAGVIDDVGSVDKGTTQTDSLPLEQQRGITIRSAVVSFQIDDVTVNLIDTPGHPDFIAEVERVLNVLDGAVLVVSAVEGVQPQTRILMRALERLRIPTLLFVNKIDRPGADYERTLVDIAERLTTATVAMASASAEGTKQAVATARAESDALFRSELVDVLADRDDVLLAAYLEDETRVSARQLRDALAAQTKQALVRPVFCGSAITGAGVDSLIAGLVELLPASAGNPSGPVTGTVFKIERAPGGEKIAYVRLFSGTVRARDELHFGDDRQAKVTAVAVFVEGSAVQRPAASAGEIAKLWGLRAIRIGDAIGDVPRRAVAREFPPPTLESVVVAGDPAERQPLRVALEQLAEQDPLINVRQDDSRRELSVSLYGEVQQQVLQATLADDYCIDVTFRDTTPIYVERPVTSGEALEVLHAESNPFLASIGLRVEPTPADSGTDFRMAVDARTLPLYLYKTAEGFAASMREYVLGTLREGLFGWRVTDCLVTMTKCTYSVPDGPPSRRGPLSTAADFRKLTPLVLMQALARAGTVVCEPTVRVELELPTSAVGAVLAALARAGAAVETPVPRGSLSTLEATLPAARSDELQRELPRLTGGEGVLDTSFAGYEPVSGEPPTRRRTLPNPLNLAEYMMFLTGRGGRRESEEPK